MRIQTKDTSSDSVNSEGIILFTRLQWSGIYYKKEISDYTLGCDIIINTTQLSQFSQEENYDYREKLMYQMSQKGISNKDISDYLNKKKSNLNALSDTPQNLWKILQKHTKKLNPKDHLEVEFVNI